MLTSSSMHLQELAMLLVSLQEFLHRHHQNRFLQKDHPWASVSQQQQLQAYELA